MRRNAWISIAEAIGSTADRCQERYKSLRDRFRKEKRLLKQTSGSGAKRKREWPLFQSMTFLEPFLIDKDTWSNLSIQSRNSSCSNEATCSNEASCSTDFEQLDVQESVDFEDFGLETASESTLHKNSSGKKMI
ncbi:transcription factor Adf-1-like [Stegodyphus dumicola]|uniref:transcription factor Adf-1-like n=1 Tax=Stegodyphus dumicola TaxID=202533 RepID=UPI0015A7C187|nr:transcription factor Adf-1-like [Stegodyphus dumicola]